MPRGRPRKTTDDVLLKSADFLGWALGGLEREIAETKERLSSLTVQAARLRKRLGGGSTAGRKAAVAAAGNAEAGQGGGRVRKKRRKMSAEAKRRISEMMRKRWAERRQGST